MKNFRFSLIFTLIFLASCQKDDANSIDQLDDTHSKKNDIQKTEPTIVLSQSDFNTIEWTDLIPQSDLDQLLSPPSYITDVEDGSIEDQISSAIAQSIAEANDDAYQNALVSTNIIEEMNNQPVRIPGFIVPLEFDDEQAITAFFLVPYFGACIHIPPPPPNQLIYVTAPHGIKVDVSYDAFWISGVLKTSLIENDLATSAYAMQMQYLELYKGE